MENKKKENDTISDFKKSIRERQDRENQRLKEWRYDIAKKAANKVLNQKTNNAYNVKINGTVGQAGFTNGSAIHIDGANDLVSINAPLQVNGRDVLKELDEMRDVMLLLRRDVDMETKYPRLRELKDEYEAALEKYKTFERLK